MIVADSVRFVSSLRAHSRFLDHALAACIPTLADFGLVFLVDGQRLRCAALAHVSKTGRGLLQVLRRVYRLRRDDRDSTVAQVVRIGRPALRRQIRPDQTPSASASSSRQVLDIHRRLDPRSALVVPIHGRDGVLGALALNYAESRRQYTAEQIPLVEHIALQMGFALERGQLAQARPRRAIVRRRLPTRLRARA